MLRGKKWLKECKATVKDPSKAYKQAKFAVLLLADMANETIAESNFVSGTIEGPLSRDTLGRGQLYLDWLG